MRPRTELSARNRSGSKTPPRIANLLALIVLIALGLGAWRTSASPRFTWWRGIHDPDRSIREAHWTDCWTGTIPGLTPEEGAEGLLKALGDPDPEVRYSAVDRLRLLKRDPRDSIRRLGPSLVDPNPILRQRAVDSLGEIALTRCSALDLAMPELRKALDDPLPNIRKVAIAYLASVPHNCSLQHEPYCRLLQRTKLDDPDEAVRKEAAEALERLCPPWRIKSY